MRFAALLLALGRTLAIAQGTPSLTITPSPVVICGSPGEAISSVPITISTGGGPVQLIATAVPFDGNWLTSDPTVFTATQDARYQLILSVTGGLIPFSDGVYYAQVVLTGSDGSRLATIPVALQVSAAGCGAAAGSLLFSNSGPLLFGLPAGVSSGTYVNLFNTFPANLTVIPEVTPASGQHWLSTLTTNYNVVSGLSYPTPLGISINSTGLAAGTYSGSVDILDSVATDLNIPVTLDVGGNSELVVTPAPLTIAVPAGGGKANIDLQVTNLGQTAAAWAFSSSHPEWLTVSPASISVPPGSTSTIAIAAAGLAPGPNRGEIRGPVTIPVTITNGAGVGISALPNPLNLTAPLGAGGTVSATVSVSSVTGAPVTFSTSAISSVSQPWLTVSPFSVTALAGSPASLKVAVDPALLPVGPAFGSVTLTPSDGSPPVVVGVNVNSGLDSSLSVAPSQLTFSKGLGQAPAAQSLTVVTSSGAVYSAQGSVDWISVSPARFVGSTQLAVAINGLGLAPGTHQDQVVITNLNTGGRQVVPVSFNVDPPVSISPAALSFVYAYGGGTIPPAQALNITSVEQSAPFTISATPSFLTVSANGGNSPSTLQIGLNSTLVAGLAPGSYSGVVTIASSGLLGGSQSVPVTLLVQAAAPSVRSIVNAASLQPGPVSPGEFVSIFGSGFGSAADTSVQFDSYRAPIVFAAPNQINAIVPYEIAGEAATNFTVTRFGVVSAVIPVQVVTTIPAIFNSILNQDGSVNSTANPAVAGSVVQLFVTGEGAYPGAVTGAVTPALPPFATFPSEVGVTVGGIPAAIAFVGEAPGLLSGILQVNVVVPGGLASGNVPVGLSIGPGTNSSQVVNISVK